MQWTKLLTLGATIATLSVTPALAAPPPPYINPPKQEKVAGTSGASKLDKAAQIEALRRKEQKIQRLIDDLEAGRPVDPSAVDRALK